MELENQRLADSIFSVESKNADLEKSQVKVKDLSQSIKTQFMNFQKETTEKLGMYAFLSPLTSKARTKENAITLQNDVKEAKGMIDTMWNILIPR